MIDFLSTKQSYSGLSLPALSGIDDLLVGMLSSDLLRQSVELEEYKYSLSEENPAIEELTEQLKYTKQSLRMQQRMLWNEPVLFKKILTTEFPM